MMDSMENNKVIKLNTSTKILYSLFNFFAPISFIFISVCVLEAYNVMATLFSIAGIFIGLFCLISNLIKYNRFLCVNDKTITVCKGKIKNPKVIQIIKAEYAILEKSNRDLVVEYENKKIKLMYSSFSLLGTICYIGPLVIIPVSKNANVALHNLFELYEILPALFQKAPKNPSKTEDFLVNFFAWGFVLFVSALGCLGLLLTPFYSFMK